MISCLEVEEYAVKLGIDTDISTVHIYSALNSWTYCTNLQCSEFLDILAHISNAINFWTYQTINFVFRGGGVCCKAGNRYGHIYCTHSALDSWAYCMYTFSVL